jgi:hypothetical protein
LVDRYVLTDSTGTLRTWRELQDNKSTRSLTIAENTRTELSRLYHHDERVAPWQGTAWA